MLIKDLPKRIHIYDVDRCLTESYFEGDFAKRMNDLCYSYSNDYENKSITQYGKKAKMDFDKSRRYS